MCLRPNGRAKNPTRADHREPTRLHGRATALLLALVLAMPLVGAAMASESGGGGGGGSAAMADLTIHVQDLYRDLNGHQIVLNVQNHGDAGADGVRVRILVDGTSVSDEDLGWLGPGTGFSYHLMVQDLGYGDITVRAEVDPADAIPESDETNNVDERLIVLGHPDLIVRLPPLPPGIQPGDFVVFEAAVTNIGEAAARDVQIHFTLDGEVTPASFAAWLLHPGETVTRWFEWTATEGEHILSVHVDPTDTVPETDETNNSDGYTFTVGATDPRPDLVLSALWVEPSDPLPGDLVRIRYQVRNMGEADAPGTDLLLGLDGDTFVETQTGTVVPGEALTFSAYWTATAGRHSIAAVIDPYGRVAEADERNNFASLEIDVAAPDLAIDQVRVTGTDAGETFTVHFEVRNVAVTPAPESRYRVLLDGTALTEVSFGPLRGGTGFPVAVELPRTPGDHVVSLEVDPHHKIVERDESNNHAAHEVALGHPDLTIRTVVPDMDDARYGDLVPLRVKIENRGSFPAHGFVWQAFADHVPFHEETVRVLEPGQRLDITVWWQVAPATQDLTFLVDAHHKVVESDELNRAAYAVSIGTPALAVETLEVSGTPEEERPTGITGRVVNTGTLGVRQATVVLEIDGKVHKSWTLDLDPGTTIDLHADWTPDHHGVRTVRLVIDPTDRFLEANETDNEQVRDVEVREATPLACRAGEPLTGPMTETCRDLVLDTTRPLRP